ncbi:MAG: carboxypeptidase regulatory-like domain-containing protein [Bryobacterales bacterium]|nr:carboxypeptidase regulatory-like domain-containing protein [Bryobacterales bacterium]
MRVLASVRYAKIPVEVLLRAMRGFFVLFCLACLGIFQGILADSPPLTISGRIFDADGRPIPGGLVKIFSSGWQVYRVRANENGEYRFAPPVEGIYTLAAMPPEISVSQRPLMQDGRRVMLRDVMTFYPSLSTPRDAQGLKVRAGEIKSGVDIHIKRVPVALVDLRGRVTGPRVSCVIGETLFQGAIYNNDDPERDYLFIVGRNNTFQIPAVPVGTYSAVLLGNRGGCERLLPHRLNVSQANQQFVLSVEPTVRVRVQVRFEDGVPHLSGLTQREFDDRTIAVFHRLDVVKNYRTRGADAFFPLNDTTCPDIPTGTYRIEGSVPVDGSYLKSARIGSKTYSPDSVKIEPGGSHLVELVFSMDTARIHPVLDRRDAGQLTRASHLTVISLPSPGVPPRIYGQSNGIDYLADFNLPPGRYIAFMATDWHVKEDVLTDVYFMSAIAADATEFGVHEKEHLELRCPLLSSEQVRRRVAELCTDQPILLRCRSVVGGGRR